MSSLVYSYELSHFMTNWLCTYRGAPLFLAGILVGHLRCFSSAFRKDSVLKGLR